MRRLHSVIDWPTAALTGVLIFSGLVLLDWRQIYPHSLIRAGLVGFLASMAARWLVERYRRSH